MSLPINAFFLRPMHVHASVQKKGFGTEVQQNAISLSSIVIRKTCSSGGTISAVARASRSQ
jgi:hypothetical protein